MSDARAPAAVPWSRYVAVGDSFTEGLWDPDPRDPARLLGWSDRLARLLSARRVAAGAPPLQYANLAIRGRLLPVILREQLDPALALGPDLVSLVGGGNDLLRPGVDVDRLAAGLEAAVQRLRSNGVDVLLSTGMDPVGSPVIRTTRTRVAVFNSHVWSMARRHGAYVLDVWGMRCLRDWRLWDPDRIHLTPDGHARAAQAALVGLGLAPDDPAWDEPLPAGPAVRTAARLRGDLDWVRAHAYPWATRRLRGRSSGEGVVAKQPALQPVLPGHPGDDAEWLDVPTPAREDGGEADAAPPPAGPAWGGDAAAHEGVRGHAPTRGSHVSDRIDYTTSDDPEVPGEVGVIRSTRHSGDVLHGGNPGSAPTRIVEKFEAKNGLVGASPDGSPEDVELYESGQDDGQIA